MKISNSPTCHPDRKHRAKGLCKQCYDTAYINREGRRDIHNARMRADYHNPNKRIKQVQQNANYRRKYGITLEEVNELHTKQQGLCAICQKKDRLALDHDHSTGKVRELLCYRCNLSLGLV